jgi:hypothetical protein
MTRRGFILYTILCAIGFALALTALVALILEGPS